MKTSELRGSALDWAVALCECGDAWRHEDVDPHFYSTDWSQGGPIIERERINIKENGYGYWFATVGASKWMRGPTPLIAVMRCYVASKLGDEVEVPAELEA